MGTTANANAIPRTNMIVPIHPKPVFGSMVRNRADVRVWIVMPARISRRGPKVFVETTADGHHDCHAVRLGTGCYA